MSWEDELDDLARERGPALVGYAYLLTGDLHTAQDLVQEALVRTFVRRRAGGGVESLESYVRRSILNVYRDLYRRRRTWGGVCYLVAEPSWYGPADAAAIAHLDVHAALARLSPRERACVVLRHYEDLSIDDIAAWLGISPGAVKRYLSDARARLGPLLAERDPGDEHGETAVVKQGRGR